MGGSTAGTIRPHTLPPPLTLTAPIRPIRCPSFPSPQATCPYLSAFHLTLRSDECVYMSIQRGHGHSYNDGDPPMFHSSLRCLTIYASCFMPIPGYITRHLPSTQAWDTLSCPLEARQGAHMASRQEHYLLSPTAVQLYHDDNEH